MIKKLFYTADKMKRITAFILCMIMMITVLPSNVFAAASTGVLQIRQTGYTYQFDSSFPSPFSNNTNQKNFVTFHMNQDSSGDWKIVYCIQYSVPTYSGVSYNRADAYDLLTTTQKELINRTLMLGYNDSTGALYGGTWQQNAMATQTLIWIISTGYYDSSYETKIVDAYLAGSSKARSIYNTLRSNVANYETIPSFAGKTAGAAQTNELKYNSSTEKYELTLTDTNNVLSNFDFSKSGITITKSGNKLTLSASGDLEETTLSAVKNFAIGDLSTIVYGVSEFWVNSTYQNFTSLNTAGTPTSVVAYLKIKTETQGNIKIKKESEDGVISGLKFRITGNGIDKTVTTESDGTILIQNLEQGTYTVTEASVPSRYVEPESQKVTVLPGRTTSISFHNVLKKFMISIAKTDSEAADAQGDSSLSGATYGLYKGDTLIDTFVTDEKGEFSSGYYHCASDWTLREITPSEGYLLDETAHNVGANPENYTVERNNIKSSVTEQVIKGNIQIVKHIDEASEGAAVNDGTSNSNAGGIEQPEEGAQFQVYLKSAGSYHNAREAERDILTTDKDGYAKTKDLPYGIYMVHQISGMEGKTLVDDFIVNITRDQKTYSYILNDISITAKIKVEKRDADTGDIITVTSGTAFKIKDADRSDITMHYDYPIPTDIDTFYINNGGWLMLPEVLKYGTYYLEEVQAPYGYVLDTELVKFKVDGSEPIVTVTKYNKVQKGSITIVKTGEVFSSVFVDETNETYQPVYSEEGLKGAVFEITAAEDIYSNDVLIAEKGDVVDTVTTNSSGTAASDLLYLGKYQVQEITAPNGGYVLNHEAKEVELTYAGQKVEITDISAAFYNERQKVQIDLYKAMETDTLFKVGFHDEICSVQFGLFAAEELTAADGTAIPTDGLMEVITVDTNGYGCFTADLPPGSYYIKEIAVDEQYILPGDVTYPVVFEYAGQETALVTLSANDGEPIENELKRGNIHGLKVTENEKPLKDALIGLFTADTEKYTEKTALMTTVSDENGYFSFSDVPYGDWDIREIQAPTGYALSTEDFEISITEEEQLIEITMVNELINGSVQVLKVDADYPKNRLSGAEFKAYEDSNNNGKFDKKDKLIGTLKEITDGVYQLDDLLYGGYFLKETIAPKYFERNKTPYYFFIKNQGEIVQVETEVGSAFINAPQTGALKIEKTSSDNNVEGMSFFVKGTTATGESYSKTFVTDENGLILIKNLRVGTYTISEISNEANEEYILPDDQTVKIKADKTTEVTFYNEMEETVEDDFPGADADDDDDPDTTVDADFPSAGTSGKSKTGDDSNLTFWVILFVIGAGGVTACTILMKRKKKEAE